VTRLGTRSARTAVEHDSAMNDLRFGVVPSRRKLPCEAEQGASETCVAFVDRRIHGASSLGKNPTDPGRACRNARNASASPDVSKRLRRPGAPARQWAACYWWSVKAAAAHARPLQAFM